MDALPPVRSRSPARRHSRLVAPSIHDPPRPAALPSAAHGASSLGIQGLAVLSETSFQQVRPSPDRSYSDLPRAHLMLDEHLRLQVEGSGLKALYSLLETGATNEYRFQQALASVDAGLAALLAVRFGTHDTPEFDCFDRGTRTRRTGACSLLTTPRPRRWPRVSASSGIVRARGR